MNVEDLRISKLREYLFTIINTLTVNREYQINANMLSNKIDDYSLDKIPTATVVERWIIGGGIRRDVYSFRSRKSYSQDTITNLSNMGFFEQFENAIKTNNEEGNLPDIENIESIECLNCATLRSATNGNQAEFDIQIQVTYRESDNSSVISL